jgi:hypothetical protein
MTQAGVIDIGYIAPSYASDKMPVSEVAQLPGMFETACEGTLAYWKVARTGLVEKYDYAPNKIRLLMEVALPPYHILSPDGSSNQTRTCKASSCAQPAAPRT